MEFQNLINTFPSKGFSFIAVYQSYLAQAERLHYIVLECYVMLICSALNIPEATFRI